MHHAQSNLPANHPRAAIELQEELCQWYQCIVLQLPLTIIKEKKNSVPMHSPIVLLTANTHTSPQQRELKAWNSFLTNRTRKFFSVVPFFTVHSVGAEQWLSCDLQMKRVFAPYKHIHMVNDNWWSCWIHAIVHKFP